MQKRHNFSNKLWNGFFNFFVKINDCCKNAYLNKARKIVKYGLIAFAGVSLIALAFGLGFGLSGDEEPDQSDPTSEPPTTEDYIMETKFGKVQGQSSTLKLFLF